MPSLGAGRRRLRSARQARRGKRVKGVSLLGPGRQGLRGAPQARRGGTQADKGNRL